MSLKCRTITTTKKQQQPEDALVETATWAERNGATGITSNYWNNLNAKYSVLKRLMVSWFINVVDPNSEYYAFLWLLASVLQLRNTDIIRLFDAPESSFTVFISFLSCFALRPFDSFSTTVILYASLDHPISVQNVNLECMGRR